MNDKLKQRIYKITSIVICSLMILFGFLVLTSPVVKGTYFSISPFDLINSQLINEIDFGGNEALVLSYYVSKYYFILHLVGIGIMLFLLTYSILTKKNKLHKYLRSIVNVILVLLFIAMLLGLNYVNIYKTLYPSMAMSTSITVSTSTPVYFYLGLILAIIKFVLDIIFDKELINDELKESSLSITTSFVLMFLTLCSIFFPLYIFPGTIFRIRGIDMMLGKQDVLSFLPMTGTYKFFLFTFTIVCIISFIANIILFIIKRKVYTFYNRINNKIGIFSLVLYALMGLNYFVVYIDSKAYNTFMNTSINTYSYMPLVLFFLYWLGTVFSKMATSKLNIEYQIYAKPRQVVDNDGNVVATNTNGYEDFNSADPIPAFSELDRKVEQFDLEYEQKLENSFPDLTLPKLVRHVIEYARYSEDRLSYGPVEIKTFIAGLAASRLTILQGMSGTGKTSLPKIFMESIDGICDLVAVESSWRDKNELLGFYSEFKKKYTPKSFTQFLYKATLNKDIPYFIVLDEMNLSRIEYYFSDFLSIMEARENKRHIKLFDIQLYPYSQGRANYLGLRDGHTIDIPTNVWFVGTANRDESTFEISDKVYDRAQTMNFDKRASKVYINNNIEYPKKFVSYKTLRELLEDTKRIGFDAENYEVIKKVENLLRPYNISFGNRVLKQIEDFVNAYVACSDVESNGDQGRYIHEAVDCIIFSKVVRKLELKQIMDIDLLIEEFEDLGLTKCVEFLHTLVETI